MRTLAVSTCLLFLLLFACGGPSGVPEDKVPVAAASMFFEAEHLFSNPLKEDKFLLGYYGPSVLDTTLHLYVLSAMGDTLYHDSWASDLFLAPDERMKPDSTQVEVILAGMRKVLDKQMPMQVGPDAKFKVSPNDFTYNVGGHGHVLSWSEGNNAVLLKDEAY